jgi:hypothetical protein
MDQLAIQFLGNLALVSAHYDNVPPAAAGLRAA